MPSLRRVSLVANHDQTLVSVEETGTELPVWQQEETERHAAAPLLRLAWPFILEREVSDINLHMGRDLPQARRNDLFEALVEFLRRVLGIDEPPREMRATVVAKPPAREFSLPLEKYFDMASYGLAPRRRCR